MSDQLSRLLLTHYIQRKTEALKRKWEEFPAWVFCAEAGTLPDESRVRKVMRKALKAAGLPLRFSPHCLRHTFASLLLQQGESPAYVQRQLGHASILLTVDTYGTWLSIGNKAAVDRLDDDESGSRNGAGHFQGRGSGRRGCWAVKDSTLGPAPAHLSTGSAEAPMARSTSAGFTRRLNDTTFVPVWKSPLAQLRASSMQRIRLPMRAFWSRASFRAT
jgi:hypothetical protein